MFIDGEDDYNFDSLHNTEFNLNNTTELYTTNQQIHTTTTRPNHIPSYSVQPLPIIQQDEETPPCFLQSGCPLVDMEDLFSFGYALNSTTVGDLFSPPPQDTVNLLSLNTSMTSDLESSCGPACKIPKRKKTNKACLSCRKSHLSCEETRPCKRCIKKGIDCVEQPVQPKCTSCPVQINPLTTNHDGVVKLNSLHQECPTTGRRSRFDDIDNLPQVIRELETLEVKSLGLMQLIVALKRG